MPADNTKLSAISIPIDGSDNGDAPYRAADVHTGSQPVDLITSLVPCIKCGYDLRGLTLDRDCPECGVAISKTLDAPLLVHEPMAWLKRQRLACGLMVLWMIWPVLSEAITIGVSSLPGWRLVMNLAAMALPLVIAVLLCRPSKVVRDQRDTLLRYSTIGLAALVGVSPIALQLVVSSMLATPMLSAMDTIVVLLVLSRAVEAAAMFVCVFVLANLAMRLPLPRTAYVTFAAAVVLLIGETLLCLTMLADLSVFQYGDLRPVQIVVFVTLRIPAWVVTFGGLLLTYRGLQRPIAFKQGVLDLT